MNKGAVIVSKRSETLGTNFCGGERHEGERKEGWFRPILNQGGRGYSHRNSRGTNTIQISMLFTIVNLGFCWVISFAGTNRLSPNERAIMPSNWRHILYTVIYSNLSNLAHQSSRTKFQLLSTDRKIYESQRFVCVSSLEIASNSDKKKFLALLLFVY